MPERGFAEVLPWQLVRDGDTPLFRQIQQQIQAAVFSRALAPGSRLPSSRALAQRLGVARSSVIAAYAELLAEGTLRGRPGSGTYVASDLVARPAGAAQRKRGSTPRRVPLSERARAYAAAAEEALAGEQRPFQLGRSLVDARTRRAWRRVSARALRELSPLHLGYTDPRGLPELRSAICEYLRAARAVRCEPEQVLVTAGTQHALDLAIRVLLEPGDAVWVEDPGYPPAWAALRAAGLQPRPIPVDAQGLRVRAGVRAAPKARAAYVTPSHQYPTGCVLSMARRLELLAWARDTGAWIVEDDYDSEFRYAGRPLASLQGLDDGERVLYVGTLNKVLFPGLRLGYLVLPPPLVRPFLGARALQDRQPSSLLQVALTEFLVQGHLASHIRRMRLQYREQRDALVAGLEARAGELLRVAKPEQGMRLLAELRVPLSDVALEAEARRAGVIVRAVSGLYRAAPPRPGLLLGFTGYTAEEAGPALARLARVVEAAARRKRL